MNEVLSPESISIGMALATTLGIAAILGAALGYFAKKTLKITLFMTGLLLVAYVVLVYTGDLPVLEIRDIKPHLYEAESRINGFGRFLIAWLSSYEWTRVLCAGIGAAGGFLIGWRIQ